MTLPIDFAVRQNPDQLAYIDSEIQLTYAQLERDLFSSVVMQLKELPSGAHVAWCPSNGLQDLLTFWAIQKRGWVACPISHRFPESGRREIVTQIDAHWLPELLEQQSMEETIQQELNLNCQTGQPATLILSSGSTGQPKAVVHSMAAHIASAEGSATNMPLETGDRWLWSLPLFHISGLSILVRCAVAGATVVGMPKDINLDARLLQEFRVTHLSAVPTQLRRLLAQKEFPSPQLKFVLLGGSSIDPKLVASARQRGVNVLTSYGLTEMASQVYSSTSEKGNTDSGIVLPGRQLKVDESGEILVRGETLCLGYYRAGKIQTVIDETGWFHTKDLGELDESGRLIVKGRIDNMFISGGENIHPENIERAMLVAFDIHQVIVVPKPDADFGARPVAFVSGDLPADWEATLRNKLKGYEIPVKILAWPTGAENSIKANRKFLQNLAAAD